MVLLPNCNLAEPRIVTNRLRERLAAAIAGATVPKFTVSVGLAAWSHPNRLTTPSLGLMPPSLARNARTRPCRDRERASGSGRGRCSRTEHERPARDGRAAAERRRCRDIETPGRNESAARSAVSRRAAKSSRKDVDRIPGNEVKLAKLILDDRHCRCWS